MADGLTEQTDNIVSVQVKDFFYDSDSLPEWNVCNFGE